MPHSERLLQPRFALFERCISVLAIALFNAATFGNLCLCGLKQPCVVDCYGGMRCNPRDDFFRLFCERTPLVVAEEESPCTSPDREITGTAR